MLVIVVENKVLRFHLHPTRRPIRRKGEKGGKEVSLSFSEKCPLCPRPDNGRLHDRRKVKTHEKKKKRLQDVLAKYLISYIGTYEIYHKTTR